jgi:FRG domain
MAASSNPLSKLSHEFGTHAIDQESGQEVFDAPSSHALVQAAGYLKYNLAKTDGHGVFFRGQTKLYGELSPTLLRGVKAGRQNDRKTLLSIFMAEIESGDLALRSVPTICREPLLQHYGIRTTWIDVVDNIWVALWFACHEARTQGWPEEYLHFEKRIPIHETVDEYAYILLISSAQFHAVSDQPGHYRDGRSETIDLRVAAPSHFVRPHAQHGVLVRRLSKSGQPAGDITPLHVGTIRIRLAAALDWLGTAATLTSHTLFPPAYYDYGYRELLAGIHPEQRNLGSIHRIQP